VNLSEKDVYIPSNLATKHGKRLSLFVVVYHSFCVKENESFEILFLNILVIQKEFSKLNNYSLKT
jgi:hypothetical protein